MPGSVNADLAESLPTFHAPPERDGPDALATVRDAIDRMPLVQSLLESFPEYVAILNSQRQVVGGNSGLLAALGAKSLDDVLGKRPGELLGCIHSRQMPGGCGTSEACRFCGAVNAMLQCSSSDSPARGECRIETQTPAGPGMWELAVVAAPISLQGEKLMALALRDLGDRNRRAAMERLFFHDLLNVAGAIQSSAELLSHRSAPEVARYSDRIHEMARQMVAQISDQRELAMAERGELEPRRERIRASESLEGVRATYADSSVARDCILRFETPDPPELEFISDSVLLERVLGNLVKNALEASPPRGMVTVTASSTEDGLVAFTVHNEGAMPREIQLQVFKRSFSTKAGTGRGLGSFSVKLLTTRYLEGKVGFTSTEEDGTAFRVVLPSLLATGDDGPLSRGHLPADPDHI